MSETNLAEKTLDETASEAFDEIIGRDSVEEVEETEEEVAEAENDEEPEIEPEAEPDASEEPEPVAEEVPEEDTAEEESIFEEAEVDPSLVNPPTTWRPVAKAKWDSLDPEIKAEVIKREQDAMNGVNNLKEKSQYADRLDSTIAPYKAFLNSKNMPPEKAIEDALNLAYTLETSTPQRRGEVIRQIAQFYKADMTVLQREIDPNQQQMIDLQQKIYNLERSQQTNLQASAEQHREQTRSRVVSFAEEIDQSGRLAHPYFHDVEPLMVSMVESGVATGDDLEALYQMAVKAHPDTSELVKTEQSSKAKAQRQEEVARKADKVKKASKINLNSTPVDNSSRKPSKTMDETLAEEAERLGIM